MNIGSLSKMQVIDLSNNNLNGSIPSSIDSMQSLVRLVLQSDNLVGTIPESIGSFLNLTKINLSKNYLTGTIPAGFSSLEKLGKRISRLLKVGHVFTVSCQCTKGVPLLGHDAKNMSFSIATVSMEIFQTIDPPLYYT